MSADRGAGGNASRHARSGSHHSARHTSSRHTKSDSRHTRQSSRHMSSLLEENIELTPARSSKRSVHWPFQSSISSRDMLDEAASSVHQMDAQPGPYRDQASILRRYASARQTLQHQRSRSSNLLRQHRPQQPSTSTVRTVASSSSLFPVPDYVAAYIRGDTPEMIAERREERSKKGTQRFPKIREGEADLEEGKEGECYGPNGSRHSLPSWVLEKNMALGDMGGIEHPGLDERRGSVERVREWLPTGWRRTMALTLSLVLALIGFFAVVLTVVAVDRKDQFWAAESTLLTEATCRAVGNMNKGAHAAAAGLGMLLLTGASHAAEVISAPTRRDLDETHGNRGALDIATGLSLRNIKSVKLGRTLLSGMVVIVSTSAVLVFNALTFTIADTASTSSLDQLDSTDCGLALNGTLVAITLILLVLIAGALLVTLIRPRFKPLVTLGDAISSLMSRPDVSARQSAHSMLPGGPSEWNGRGTPAQQALVPNGDREMVVTRWMGTVSLGRWIVWLVTLLVPLGLAAAALGITLSENSRLPVFGVPAWMRESSIVTSGTILAVLVSLPQVLVAVLYLSSSSLLTAFFAARELDGYEAAARAAAGENGVVRLRVSQREEGMQTTSSYITLPPFVTLMLWIIFAGMSFLANQSLTLRVPGEDNARDAPSIGLSTLPLIMLAALLGLVAAGTALMSVLCRAAVPQRGNGSQAVAAWCRFWSASPEDMGAHSRQGASTSDLEQHVPSTGSRTSWGGASVGQGTIASGMWMAAGRR